jgi:hypothetical protein
MIRASFSDIPISWYRYYSELISEYFHDYRLLLIVELGGAIQPPCSLRPEFLCVLQGSQ